MEHFALRIVTGNVHASHTESEQQQGLGPYLCSTKGGVLPTAVFVHVGLLHVTPRVTWAAVDQRPMLHCV